MTNRYEYGISNAYCSLCQRMDEHETTYVYVSKCVSQAMICKCLYCGLIKYDDNVLKRENEYVKENNKQIDSV